MNRQFPAKLAVDGRSADAGRAAADGGDGVLRFRRAGFGPDEFRLRRAPGPRLDLFVHQPAVFESRVTGITWRQSLQTAVTVAQFGDFGGASVLASRTWRRPKSETRS